jgi:hypothetical protein
MVARIVSQTGSKVIIEIEVDLSSSMLDSEGKLQAALNEGGTLATGKLLEYFDTSGQPIKFGSVSMTSKGKVDCCYQTPYGEVVVARHLYQTYKGGKTFCPLEQNARILLSATPMFAMQISHKYAELGARRVKFDLEENHGRSIANSFVQNVAEAVSAIAQATEEDWQYETPKQDEPVASVSIGIDGTCMLTVDDGWRQAMVGTVSLYSAVGERLHTVYIGATPEYGKESFLERMEREITNVKTLCPKATFVGVADGAADNWTFLDKHTSIQTLDFFHASEYLTKVADAVYARKSNERHRWLEDSCHRLKHNRTGPGVILKELRSFRAKRLGKEKEESLEKAITYFENQKKRMNYASNIENNLPIGSGVTEAACKVLVKQRLCGSGMRWKEKGAAAVLALRALSYTEGRWKQFWQKIDASGVGHAA